MNCSAARNAMDNYLDRRLSGYDLQRLELHLASCPSCSEEVHARSSFDRTMRQTLHAAVEHQTLSSAASARIVYESQQNLRRGVWQARAMLGTRLMSGAVAAVLVVVGLFVLSGSIPIPSGLRPVPLQPIRKLILSGQHADTVAPLDDPIPPQSFSLTVSPTEPPALTLSRSEKLVEPWRMHPGDTFTVTALLHSDLPRPLDAARIDLDISGPSGYFQFPLVVKGPLPAHGVSVLRVTSDALDSLCQEKYLIRPAEIFSVPGNYMVRVVLFSPLAAETQ